MDFRRILYKIYWQTEHAILPGFKNSREHYENVLREYCISDVRWLDVGAGHQVLPEWRFQEERKLVKSARVAVGLDRDLNSLRKHRTLELKCQGDLGRLPFRNESLDLVTANMVVEHLEAPELEFSEINRILRTGGIFIFHTPNRLGYSAFLANLVPEVLKRPLIRLLEGRSAEDVFKTFYRANTQRSITKLSRISGFEVVRLEMLGASAVLAAVPLIAAIELFVIKILMTKRFSAARTNIIGVLRKV